MEDFAQLSRDLPIFRIRAEFKDAESLGTADPFEAFRQELEASLIKGDEAGLLKLYDLEFNRLTNLGLSPPEPSGSSEAKTLYSELFFRWIHSKTQATIPQREASFSNYLELFMYLRHAKFNFPSQWLWDMVDEFLFQFQSFWLNVAKTDGEGFVEGVWEVKTVQHTLEELVVHFNIQDHGALKLPCRRLKNENLGYFAYYGQVRLQCQLGDFAAALKLLQVMDQPVLQFYKTFPACYLNLCYYAGHAFFAAGQLVDAAVVLNAGLTFFHNVRPFLQKSYLYNILVKKSEQLLALLAIAYVMVPYDLSAPVRVMLREKLGEKFVRLQKGEDIGVFEEVFVFSAPKWIVPLRSSSSSRSPNCLKFLSLAESSLSCVMLLSYARVYRSATLAKVEQITGLAPSAVVSIVQHLLSLASVLVVADGFSEANKRPASFDIRLTVQGNKLISTKQEQRLPLLGLIQHQQDSVTRVLTSLASN